MNDRSILITKALEAISAAQLPDGSFLNCSSADPEKFTKTHIRKTTFFAANIVLCLQSVLKINIVSEMDRAIIYRIESKAVSFLLSERSEKWSFNYWSKTAPEYSSLPYPDDLDDTFSALAAIFNHRSDLFDQSTLEEITRLLVERKKLANGCFETWITQSVKGMEWRDVDPVVNSTIGFFLTLLNVRAPFIETFLQQTFESGNFGSPYYPTDHHASYFISRFHNALRNRHYDPQFNTSSLITSSDRSPNSLELAMDILTLINLGANPEKQSILLKILTETLMRTGFNPHPFCIDPKIDGKRHYAGASALTAAFCLEALYRGSVKMPKKISATDRGLSHENIKAIALQECSTIAPELREALIASINKIWNSAIVTVIYEIKDSLEKNAIPMPDIADRIALCTFFGWIAYRIYDDILDGEGNPKSLLCANFLLRRVIEISTDLEKKIPGAAGLTTLVLTAMDEANMWEQEHCHLEDRKNISIEAIPDFGNYENLASRDSGYMLGPLIVLLAAGLSMTSREFRSAEALLRHYLIARQLSDDARDWESDLMGGTINSVSALLLQMFRQNHATDRSISIMDSLPKLKNIFWEHGIDQFAHVILFHLEKVKNLKQDNAVFKNTTFLEIEISRLTAAANHALKCRKKGAEILTYYANKDAIA